MLNKLILILFLFCSSVEASAKWIELNDSPTNTKFYNVNITVNADGTSEEIIEFKDKILNEDGRQLYSNFIKYYNGNDSKFKIIEAYTLNGEIKHSLDLALIEDMPLASSPNGFDQMRQVLIAFPNVEVNSEIFLKYSIVKYITDLPNFYSERFFFANDGCWESSEIKIKSKLPIYSEINDPDNVILTNIFSKEDFQIFEAKLKKPICRKSAKTTEVGYIADEKFPFFSVSTSNSWTEFAKINAKEYFRVINQKLPDLFKISTDTLSSQKSQIETINYVTSFVNDKLRYMGNWNSVKGQYVPRDLNDIALNQDADCKDFTAVTAAILKNIGGFKVQPALVIRGEGIFSQARKIPSMDQFNHVFLKITLDDGKILWVDPTNDVSMAQGIFADIADKMVLVLDEQDPVYERTPTSIDGKLAEYSSNAEFSIKDSNLYVSKKVDFKNEAAVFLTAKELYSSRETIANQLYKMSSDENLAEEDKISIDFPELKSRIVKDTSFLIKYKIDNKFYYTNYGLALAVPYNSMLDYVRETVPNQLADIYIGPVSSFSRLTKFKNIKFTNITQLSFNYSSPWLDLKREVNIEKNDTQIIDYLLIKKNFITNEELKSEEYKKLQKFIKKRIQNQLVVIN